MSAIYVANYTHQHQDFNYRVPEHEKIHTTIILAGRQMKLPIDFNDHQRNFVVKQLERMGARPVDDVRSIKNAHGLIFSIDREIKSEKIDEARTIDESIRQNVSTQQVIEAGVAVAGPQTPSNLRTSTLEVRELNPIDRVEETKGGIEISVTADPKSKNAPPRRNRNK